MAKKYIFEVIKAGHFNITLKIQNFCYKMHFLRLFQRFLSNITSKQTWRHLNCNKSSASNRWCWLNFNFSIFLGPASESSHSPRASSNSTTRTTASSRSTSARRGASVTAEKSYVRRSASPFLSWLRALPEIWSSGASKPVNRICASTWTIQRTSFRSSTMLTLPAQRRRACWRA